MGEQLPALIEEGRLPGQTWQQQIARISPERLVFLDETGTTTEMTRRYGRGFAGERVREAAPAGHWRTLTLLGAMSAEDLVATMTVEAPTDREVFWPIWNRRCAPDSSRDRWWSWTISRRTKSPVCGN